MNTIMRNSLSLIATLMILWGLSSCGSAGEFSRFKKYDNVDVVHIPKFVTHLTSCLVKSDKGPQSLVKGLGSLDVVSCEDEKNFGDVIKEAESVIEKEKSELILEVTEAKERVRIYGNSDTNKGKVKNVIIISEEPGELSVVRINGSINMADIMNMK